MRILSKCGILFILCIATTTTVYGAQGNSSIAFRSFYPSSLPFCYRSLYLYYSLHYSALERIHANVSIVKGSGEEGYYPSGYFKESNGGLYEKGSFFICFKDYLGFKKVVVGNYLLSFGQGLLFGPIFPLLLTNPYYDLARYRDGIYLTRSVSKTKLLEGIAAEHRFGNFFLRPFVSWNRYDCTAGESSYYKYNDNDSDGIENEEDDDDFTGRGEDFPSGYSCKNDLLSCIGEEPGYANESERAKRNKLRENILGINLSSRWERLRMGATISYTFLNRLVDPYYNYDPDKGDKTGYFFRGKDLFASHYYFKLYNPVEVFGEIVATWHKTLSYYPEFNGDDSLAVGFSGGIRKRGERLGFIGWGAYLPAHLTNPHALEYPHGSHNIMCGLVGFHFFELQRRLTTWVYLYKELYSKDYPGHPETGFSYTISGEFPLGKRFKLRSKQRFMVIDNYFDAPLKRSYKIASRLSLKYDHTLPLGYGLCLENRFGNVAGEDLGIGTGIGGEIICKTRDFDASCAVFYFTTDKSRFAYLYPHEPSVAGWSFFPASVKGNGFTGSVILVKRFPPSFLIGTKFKYIIDLQEMSRNSGTFYITTEKYF